MKTLQEIKDEVAIEDGYTSWEQVGAMGVSDWIVDEIAKRFALEVAKESIRNTAENAIIDDWAEINKESITADYNIPEL